MPDKITNIADVSVSFLSVFSFLFTLFAVIGTIISSYAVFVIKSVNRQITELKDSTKSKIFDLEKVILSYQEIHIKLFEKGNATSERLTRVESDLSNLKNNHDKNHGGK